MQKFIFLFFFILNVTGAISQQVYTIPWASQQPKFVFPIYFEEGGGQKDTLYLGYDTSATGLGVTGTLQDSVFGVKRIPIDTNLFYVCWADDLYKSYNPPTLEDNVYKANVSPLGADTHGEAFFPLAPEIFLNKGVLPLKISWDINSLYSDSMPFFTAPSLPKGEGRLTFFYSFSEYLKENGITFCNSADYLLITDSTVLAFCSAKDSVTVYNMNNISVPVNSGLLNFILKRWSGVLVDVPEQKYSTYNIYPNPFFDYLIIESKLFIGNDVKIIISDLYGKIKHFKYINASHSLKLDLNDLPEGFYLIEILSGINAVKFKVVKL